MIAKFPGITKGRGAIAAILLASLFACAIQSDIVVSSTGAAKSQNHTVFIQTDGDNAGLRAEFGSELRDALGDKNAISAAAAGIFAEYSVSQRDAESGLADPGLTSTGGVAWQSERRRRKLTDGCDVQRLRGSLLLIEKTSGEVVYRGTGDVDTCGANSAQLRDLARALVADAYR